MSDVDSARALHQDILNYIDEAEALLRAGNPSSLSGFDSRVDAFCQRVVALSEAERAPFIALLEQLQERMEELTHAMRAARDTLHTEMDTLNQRQRALHAYKTPKGGA